MTSINKTYKGLAKTGLNFIRILMIISWKTVSRLIIRVEKGECLAASTAQTPPLFNFLLQSLPSLTCTNDMSS